MGGGEREREGDRAEEEQEVEGAVRTEWCTVPETQGGWRSQHSKIEKKRDQVERGRKGKKEGEREREKSSYFTPMQHAEEIQVPFKLHNCISKTLNNTLVGLIHKGY